MFPGLQTSPVICDCEYIPLIIGIIVSGTSYKIHHDMRNFRLDMMSDLDVGYEYTILWRLQPLNSHREYIDRVVNEEYIEIRDTFSRVFDHYNRYRLRTLQILGISLILALVGLAMAHIIGIISVYFYYSILFIEVLSVFAYLIAIRYMVLLYRHKNKVEEFIAQNQEELIDIENKLEKDNMRMMIINAGLPPIDIEDIVDRSNENTQLTDFLFGCSIGGTIGFLIAGWTGSVLLGTLIGMLSLRNVNVKSVIDWI